MIGVIVKMPTNSGSSIPIGRNLPPAQISNPGIRGYLVELLARRPPAWWTGHQAIDKVKFSFPRNYSTP